MTLSTLPRHLIVITIVFSTWLSTLLVVPTVNAQGLRIGVGGRGGASGGWSNRGGSSAIQQQVINSARRALRAGPNQPPRSPGHYQPMPHPVRRAPAPVQPRPTHPVATPPSRQTEPPAPPKELTPEEQARSLVQEARKAFKSKEYSTALERVNEVLELVPNNADAHQFRSLIHFAMDGYREAAAEAYEAFLRGPAWTWETIRDFYPGAAVYTEQFRKLQKAAADQPESLEVQFLLAYHYMMLGHLKHSETQLRKVLEIRPGEPVSEQLLVAVRSAIQAQDNEVETAGR
jgi:predicted Zn-dependent protease